jgi:hypothetical protein
MYDCNSSSEYDQNYMTINIVEDGVGNCVRSLYILWKTQGFNILYKLKLYHMYIIEVRRTNRVNFRSLCTHNIKVINMVVKD